MWNSNVVSTTVVIWILGIIKNNNTNQKIQEISEKSALTAIFEHEIVWLFIIYLDKL